MLVQWTCSANPHRVFEHIVPEATVSAALAYCRALPPGSWGTGIFDPEGNQLADEAHIAHLLACH